MTSNPQDVMPHSGVSLGAGLTRRRDTLDSTFGPVDVWNRRYFDGRLSPWVVELLRGLDHADDSAQAFADRAFRLMRAARIEATDISLLAAWQIGQIAPHVLPSAWGGKIPPITAKGRHKLVDEYVVANPWHRPSGRGLLVDLGCGFPPFTTVDSANRLPDWDVIGADPAFGRYLVYDELGDYAWFTDASSPRYYPAGVADQKRRSALHQDPAATNQRFTALLEELLPLLPDDDPSLAQVAERRGARLVRHPLRQFEAPNLRFVEGGIGTLAVDGGADVIRCMNVLGYFDRAFRTRTLEWAGTVLKPGGLFICGMNWARSTSSRYTVYQKVDDTLVRREFAFGIECVRPIDFLSWYTLHHDEAEALQLADAARTLRSDETFRRAYDDRLDGILATTGMCPRDADGYLGTVPLDLTPTEREERMESIGLTLGSAGLTDAAVRVLRGAGRTAWINCVGHVASLPDEITSLDALEGRA
jgi:hypothetical protein